MRRNYQLRGWRRRLETVHRKLVEIADDVEASGGESAIYRFVSDAFIEVHQALSQIEGEIETKK